MDLTALWHKIFAFGTHFWFYYTHFEIPGCPCNLIGSNWCDFFHESHQFFALNRIFFPTDQISRLAWSKQPNCRKWKTKSIMWQILQLLSPKTLIPPLLKWMNLISKQLSTASIKYLTWPSPVFGRFQNGWDEVMIEPRVVQFWAEIILVIFEIMRMISAQIALHSVQLLL